MSFSIYAAGPITGISYKGATDWRQGVSLELEKFGIITFSPMRHKDYLAGTESIGDSYEGKPLSCRHGIMQRDFYDVRRADLIFVNFLGATTVSKGTVMELAWAFAYQKPTVVIMEPGNIHEHAMVNEAISFRVLSIEEAIHVTKSILLPGDIGQDEIGTMTKQFGLKEKV